MVEDFVDAHPDVPPLEMVPTEYSDLADSPYKTALREQLDPSVVVEWTGVGVIAPTVSAEQARQARELFGHPILLWDNYPVNDYTTSRLLLGPYTGREAGVAKAVTGITANPMVQAEASSLALFTSADYAWNPDAYDPRAAFLASVADLGGRAAPSLRIFAENNYSSLLDATESPTTTPLITATPPVGTSGLGSPSSGRGGTRECTAAGSDRDVRPVLAPGVKGRLHSGAGGAREVAERDFGTVPGLAKSLVHHSAPSPGQANGRGQPCGGLVCGDWSVCGHGCAGVAGGASPT